MPATGSRFGLEGVGVAFDGRAAVDDVSLNVEAGELVAFVGPSGAGKTSLLKLLNATLRPTAGAVRVDDTYLIEYGPRELRQLRTSLGFVYQDFNLVPNLRVSQNVLAGRLGRMGFFRSMRAMIRPTRPELERVHEILERVGIPDKIFQRTDRLSGGQRQRVAIARALYQDARALLVDEPVSSLDPTRARDTIAMLTDIAKESDITLVASMHDVALAREFFPRLVGVREGRVVFDAAPSDVSDAEFTDLYRIEDDAMLADGC